MKSSQETRPARPAGGEGLFVHLWACGERRKGGDYDFVRIHKTLKVTPARAAGVTNRLWDMINMVSVPEA